MLAAAGGAELSVSGRDAQKTVPFDMDPSTFMGSLDAISTDMFLLFYSPTCPDCEKLMPQWAKIAGSLDNRQDLTLLTVADPEGLAPGHYLHGENPALFFIHRDHKDTPVPFDLGQLHAFIDTDETKATEAAIRKAMTEFALSHLADAAKQGAVQPVTAPKLPAAALAGENDANERMLTAKLLVALQNHERAGMTVQMQLVRSDAYAKLPVAQALTLLTPQEVREPLAMVAAKLLDEEPQARDAATRYAQWYLETTGGGRAPTAAALGDVVSYVLPAYLRSAYDTAAAKIPKRRHA